ncbi:MAG: glycoside hydrolase family 30 beta sandwich domain-containing protein [Bacteroidota bacterium]|nr:glycoside hydrolase family 30 beta sandwich domain-containing protein [Bacteroidota bacterium]
MKNRTLTIIFLSLILIVSTAFAQKATVKIYPEIKRQVIKSIGGNYCQANYSQHAADAIGDETLREFRPTHVRVALPMRLRNAKFEDYRGENYTKQPLVLEVLDELKRMKSEFGVVNFTISVWDVPDEFIADPTKTAQRVIKPEAYDEVIQMLTDFFLKAKNEYGVEIDQFSFNESDGGYQIIFSPEATIAFVKKAGQKWAEAGLKTKFLLADTAQTKGTVEFATQIMADKSIWNYLGSLSFHCWWSEDIPNSEFERIAGFGKAWNKEVWCAELGFDAMSWKIKDMNKSYDYALRFAKISHRMIKYAEVEVSLYWTWQNNYAIMSADTKEKYPSYYITRHQTEFMNTGTQIVHSTSSDPEILAISAIRSDGSKVLQIINIKKEAVTIKVSGFESKKIDGISTSETNIWEILKNVAKTKNGKTEFQVKAQSVSTLVFN